MATERLRAYFDGACEPFNPGGNMGIGACIYEEGVEIYSYSHFVKKDRTNSNNVAEYLGLTVILNYLIAQQYSDRDIEIFGDSKLVINQMKGLWRIKQGRYVDYAIDCTKSIQLLKHTKNIRFRWQWIPREENYYADELSKASMIKNKVVFKIQPL